MKDKIKSMFECAEGRLLYESAVSAIEENKMKPLIDSGVLIGFSGGADSVMLTCFLTEYKRREGDFNIVSLHVNHGIRGAEADRDEAFSRSFSESLGIESIVSRFDVPKMAKERKLGIEECARECRYAEFARVIGEREDISSIAIAHNSDDNIETVILNMMRGGGTRGLSGISPVRDNIFRPLIYCKKASIESLLNKFEIEYVFDSTNAENEYKRNFVRHRIITALSEISESPQDMCARSSRNLRLDDEYICSVADEFIAAHREITNKDLLSLHESVFARVLFRMSNVSLSFTNLKEIRALLVKNNFSYSLPEGKFFVSEAGICSVREGLSETDIDYCLEINFGINVFDDFCSGVILTDKKINKSFLKIYKLSTQVSLSSAIIEGGLYLRPRREGDSLYFGGITRKLKKVFCDKKIPKSKRALVPILCDSKGPVFVPGLGVRDDGGKKELFVALGVGKDEDSLNPRFYFANEFVK